jgi:hypothetical protein
MTTFADWNIEKLHRLNKPTVKHPRLSLKLRYNCCNGLVGEHKAIWYSGKMASSCHGLLPSVS